MIGAWDLHDAAVQASEAARWLDRLEREGIRVAVSARELREVAAWLAVASALDDGGAWRWSVAAEHMDGILPAEAVACARLAMERMDDLAAWSTERESMIDIIRRGGV